MGVTAENLAEKYGVTREESDNFALRYNDIFLMKYSNQSKA